MAAILYVSITLHQDYLVLIQEAVTASTYCPSSSSQLEQTILTKHNKRARVAATFCTNYATPVVT